MDTLVCAAGRTIIRQNDPDFDHPCDEPPDSILSIAGDNGETYMLNMCYRHVMMMPGDSFYPENN